MHLRDEDPTVSPLQTLLTWSTSAASLLPQVCSLSGSVADRTEGGREWVAARDETALGIQRIRFKTQDEPPVRVCGVHSLKIRGPPQSILELHTGTIPAHEFL